MTWNFATVFEALARVRPGDTALMHGERTVSWGELDDRAARLASALRAAGLNDGDVVAQYLPNRPEYIESFVAAAKARLAPMNTNYRYVEDELLEVWQDANARAVIYDPSFADRVAAVRDRMPGVKAWIEAGSEYESLIAANEPIAVGSGDDDSLVLIYTGGTTGRPKGVMWRQADLLSLLNSIAARKLPDGAGPDELVSVIGERRDGVRALVACPLMHGFGLFYSLSELISGDTLITLPTVKYDPELLLDAVQTHKLKSIALVGDAFAKPLLDKLDNEPQRWDVSSIRVLMSSGVMWSAPVKEGLLRHMPKARMIDGLGSSEASSIASTASTAGQVADTASFEPSDRAGVLLDDGTLAQPGDGKVGKLAVTGWLPMGYLNDPKKTAEVFVEAAGRRWSMPGDMATIEANGRIKLLGRGSSCINTGGEKVFPEEVEQVLVKHPGVVDVAVVGVPDERFGQSIVALVEPRGEAPSETELREHVRASLAGYKVPRLFHAVESVDRLPNGKLDHRKLADVARAAWAAGVSAAAS
ncbi:AMP-binding protein [Amycolatopsis acidicola]|uniref:AMP-binding protein n=1 Tax=Amycolatopsis acidicola TaxID=2596893 RepID=A0A5N0UVD1_9PSEU|nr:AMP-binding protein [Amycolatopsis acidicola]KAA9156768.1 AMP-binding protein [Amycolatopsis acidicola]